MSRLHEHHRNAAEHHEHAAHQHRQAAKHHKSGNTERGSHHAHAAHGHSLMAQRHANKASRSHAMEESGMGEDDFDEAGEREHMSNGNGHSHGMESRMSRSGRRDEEEDDMSSNMKRSPSSRNQKSRGGRHAH